MITIKLFTVYYRTGGTLNFKWKKFLPMGLEQAREYREDMERMGYVCHYAPTEQLDAIGLPDTFEPDDKKNWDSFRAELVNQKAEYESWVESVRKEVAVLKKTKQLSNGTETR